jgi:hypothetical protein
MFVKTKLTGFDFHQQSRKFVYFNGNASVYGGQSKFYECVYGMTIFSWACQRKFHLQQVISYACCCPNLKLQFSAFTWENYGLK